MCDESSVAWCAGIKGRSGHGHHCRGALLNVGPPKADNDRQEDDHEYDNGYPQDGDAPSAIPFHFLHQVFHWFLFGHA